MREREKQRDKERLEREEALIHWFKPQMPTRAGSGPDRSQEPGTQFRLCCLLGSVLAGPGIELTLI